MPSSVRSSRQPPTVKTHFSPVDESVISSEKFQRSQKEPSDVEMSSLSDKLFKPDYFDPDDEYFQVWRKSFHVQQHEITLRQDTF